MRAELREISVTVQGPTAELTLRRPDLRNALSAAMGEEIREAVARLNAIADLRAVLVSGQGSAFSSGGDFEFLRARMAEPPETSRRAMLHFYGLFLSIRELHVPSIALLQGPAIGAGLCFAMACDLRVAARSARLGVNFVKVGLHPGMGATHLLRALVGPAAATELLLTGRIIDADEALRIGLVHRVVDDEALDTVGRELAAEIAQAAPIAVAQTKASLTHPPGDLDAALQREAYAQGICYGTEDMHEAIAAFRAKRSPTFQGK